MDLAAVEAQHGIVDERRMYYRSSAAVADAPMAFGADSLRSPGRSPGGC